MDLFQKQDYKFLTDAYYGTGGFKDGNYLVPHPRETPEKYNQRKELSYYLNYTAATVNSHVDPIFRTEPSREWAANDLFSIFVQDSDTMGTNLSRFMKRAALNAKLYAVAFIIIDNVANQPNTLADAITQRTLPYVYIVKPEQVTNYTTNSKGKLISITYEVAGEENINENKSITTWEWTETTWKMWGKETKEGKNFIGRLPVVPLFSKAMDNGNIKPQSEFYNIARTNKRLFNLCSEIDELIRNQAFNILTYPAGEGQTQIEVKEITVGTENVMSYDGQLSNKPEFIAPSSDPLQQLRDERQDLIQEIYRMAELSHVTGVQQKTSGVAKAWDFQQANQCLVDMALNCEGAERQIAEIFELLTSSKLNYNVKYSDDFGIVDVTGELDNISTALGLNIGSKFNTEVKKRAVSVYLNDIPEEQFDAVVKDIESRGQDETYSFNGAQVTSAVEVLLAVAAKTLAPETAKLMLMAFFGLDEGRAGQMVDAQKNAEAPSVPVTANAQY
ncbi:hypothetical protein [Pelosinus sp. sgz500959]|uniref:hypothetical protein n=1 Tax=Pelosinus sp. sgz500959 TaxID=3242472 RepID=UPI00366E07BC